MAQHPFRLQGGDESTALVDQMILTPDERALLEEMEEGQRYPSVETLETLLDLYHLWQLAKYAEKTDTDIPRRVRAEEWNLERTSEVPLYKEYEDSFPKKFREKFRMNQETFYKLLDKVTPLIIKKDTVMRPAIPA
jgi:hypothetical protein